MNVFSLIGGRGGVNVGWFGEGGSTPKARRTKERTVEAALGLFANRGYEAMTMRDVAQEAGVGLGLGIGTSRPRRRSR
jgi:hypothetical protein